MINTEVSSKSYRANPHELLTKENLVIDNPLFGEDFIFGESILGEIDQMRKTDDTDIEISDLLEKAREDMLLRAKVHSARNGYLELVAGDEIIDMIKSVMLDESISSKLLKHFKDHYDPDELFKLKRGYLNLNHIKELPLDIIEAIIRDHVARTKEVIIDLETEIKKNREEYCDLLRIELEDSGIDSDRVINRVLASDIFVADDFELKRSNYHASELTSGKKSSVLFAVSSLKQNLRKISFHEFFHVASGKMSKYIREKTDEDDDDFSLQQKHMKHGFNLGFDRIDDKWPEQWAYNQLNEGMTELMAIALDQGIPFRELGSKQLEIKFQKPYFPELRLVRHLLFGGNSVISFSVFLKAYLEDYQKDGSGSVLPDFVDMHHKIDDSFNHKGYLAKVIKFISNERLKILDDKEAISISEIVDRLEEDPEFIY